MRAAKAATSAMSRAGDAEPEEVGVVSGRVMADIGGSLLTELRLT
jgi:hypothetical protein